MNTWKVTVMATVKETYYVDAETEADALEIWDDVDPWSRDCVDHSVESIEKDEDE